MLVELTDEDVEQVEEDEEDEDEEGEKGMGVLVAALVSLAFRSFEGEERRERADSEPLVFQRVSLFEHSSTSTSSNSSSPISRDSMRRRRRIVRVFSRRLVSLALPFRRPRSARRPRLLPSLLISDTDFVPHPFVFELFRSSGIFENLLSFNPALAETLVETTTALDWLLKRIDVKEYDSNKQYASEVSDPKFFLHLLGGE